MKYTAAQKRLLLESDEQERQLARTSPQDNEAYLNQLIVKSRRGEIPYELIEVLSNMLNFQTQLPKDRQVGDTRWYKAFSRLFRKTMQDLKSIERSSDLEGLEIMGRELTPHLYEIINSMDLINPRTGRPVGGADPARSMLDIDHKLASINSHFIKHKTDPAVQNELISKLLNGFVNVVFNRVRNVVNQI